MRQTTEIIVELGKETRSCGKANGFAVSKGKQTMNGCGMRRSNWEKAIRWEGKCIFCLLQIESKGKQMWGGESKVFAFSREKAPSEGLSKH